MLEQNIALFGVLTPIAIALFGWLRALNIRQKEQSQKELENQIEFARIIDNPNEGPIARALAVRELESRGLRVAEHVLSRKGIETTAIESRNEDLPNEIFEETQKRRQLNYDAIELVKQSRGRSVTQIILAALSLLITLATVIIAILSTAGLGRGLIEFFIQLN